jgi:glucokinase-like ROK family protein
VPRLYTLAQTAFDDARGYPTHSINEQERTYHVEQMRRAPVRRPPQRAGADHNVMRELNRTLVLDVLRSSSPTSRASIAQITSLAKPTVSGIVDELIREGLVRELGLGAAASSGGRPPMLLEFNVRSQFVVGVHVGSRTTTIVVSDASGQEIARHQMRTPRDEPLTALKKIGTVIKETTKASGISIKRVAAVGVALPGLTDFHSGVCVLAPNLGWRNVPVRDVLNKMLGTTVFVHHLGQTSVVAESLEGATKGEEDVVLLYAGSGVGAGILSNGRVFHGHRGIAGEIGHCRVPGATELCSCGKIGCLETVASARALVNRVHEGIARGEPSSLAGKRQSRLTPRDIAVAAEDGDAVARAAITDVARNLGLGASWLINLFDPAVLIIAGGMADIGELLLEPLRATIDELAMNAVLQRVEVRTSALGQDAEVRGAVLLALQQAETYYRIVFQT